MDAAGRSGGVAIGWLTSMIRCENFWGFHAGIGIEVYSRDIDRVFTMVNIYGPYQERLLFQDRIFSMSWWNSPDLIVGGDLNFSLGEAEIWGESAQVDELIDYFRQALIRVGVSDIPTPKPLPTWRNRRVGVRYIPKHLDRFLVADPLVNSMENIRQWVKNYGDSDHNLVMLEFAIGGVKPLSPFKFNRDWLNLEDFKKLVKELWIPHILGRHRSTAIHFVENLGRIEQATKKWAHAKRVNDDRELSFIERELGGKMNDPVKDFSSYEECSASFGEAKADYSEGTRGGLEAKKQGHLAQKR